MTKPFDIEAFRITANNQGPSWPGIRVAHMDWCAIHDEGPCTCDTDEIYEELMREEAGVTAEDFE